MVLFNTPLKPQKTKAFLTFSGGIEIEHWAKKGLILIWKLSNYHCVKSVRIWRFSGPYFPSFGLNTERYSISLHIQFDSERKRTRKFRIRTLFTQCIIWQKKSDDLRDVSISMVADKTHFHLGCFNTQYINYLNLKLQNM